MTFQKIKDTLVTERKLLTQKELNKLSLNLALVVLGFCLSLGLLTYATVGFGTTVIIIILSILAYTWIFDFAVESEKSLERVRKITKFWWFTYIILAIVFIVLKLTRFI